MSISNTLRNMIDSARDISKSAKKNISKAVAENVDDVKKYMKNNNMSVNNAEEFAEKAYKNARKVKREKVDDVISSIDSKTLRGVASAAAKTEDVLEGMVVGAGEKAYKAGKWAAKKTIKKPVKNPDSVLGYDFKLTTAGTLAAVAILGGYPILSSALEATERANYGEIEGGLPSRTVNATFTPANNLVEAAQSGAINNKRFKESVLSNNLSSRVANVDPEIVFALHSLRNSKDMLGNEVVG